MVQTGGIVRPLLWKLMVSLPSPGGSDAAAEDAQLGAAGHVSHRHLQRHRALDGQPGQEERL